MMPRQSNRPAPRSRTLRRGIVKEQEAGDRGSNRDTRGRPLTQQRSPRAVRRVCAGRISDEPGRGRALELEPEGGTGLRRARIVAVSGVPRLVGNLCRGSLDRGVIRTPNDGADCAGKRRGGDCGQQNDRPGNQHTCSKEFHRVPLLSSRNAFRPTHPWIPAPFVLNHC